MHEQRPDRRLTAAVEAVAVTGPTTYTWLGESFDLPAPVLRLATPEGLRAGLVNAITWRLYADFFTAGRPVVPPGRRSSGSNRAFARALSAANAGTGALERGWTYVGTDGDRVVVERLGLHVWASPEEVVQTGPAPPVARDEVALWITNEAPCLSPGFYMALSNRGLDPDRPRLLDRFYFNIGAAHASKLMELVTRRLNAAGMPFRLKVVDDPEAFDRCDSAVLTFQRKDRVTALEHVRQLYEDVRSSLQGLVPGLTRRLAPGLGFAEDPGDGVSFGAQRCGLIADALVEAHERGLGEEADRMAVVRAHLARASTTPETPHLGSDSGGEPVFPPAPSRIEETAPCP